MTISWHENTFPHYWYCVWAIPVDHDDVIKWKHFPRDWPFVRRIYRSPVNSPHKGQSRGPLMFTLICVWINDWVNNGEAGDLRRYRAHYDITLMFPQKWGPAMWSFWCFLVVTLNTQPNKNWFETPWRSCDATVRQLCIVTVYTITHAHTPFCWLSFGCGRINT